MSIRKKSYFVLLITGMLTALPTMADDTDIFLGKSSEEDGDDSASTMFFLLDNSGSMNGKPSSGGEESKLDLLKSAMREFLIDNSEGSTLKDVKVGFGSYYEKGGLVNYPVLPIDDTGIYGAPVREEIIEAVDELKATGSTPLVGSYYESVAYMLGRPVLFGEPSKKSENSAGTNGGSNSKGKGNSSGSTSSPGIISGHEWQNGSHPSTMEGDPPVYNFDELTMDSCMANNIVILSDGKATHSAYTELSRSAQDMLDVVTTDPDSGRPCVDYGFNQERCGSEIAEYAVNRLDSDDPDAPPVYTHTIGFDIDPDSNAEQYLQRVANAGGGQYVRVEDKEQLIQSFKNLVKQPATTTSSFSAPSVPINTSNLLYSNAEVFVNLFATERKPIWNGNVKKFEICQPDSSGCKTGQYVGSNGQVATDADGNLLDDFVGDVWDDGRTPSASNVLSGGVGSKVGDWKERNIYTWTATEYPDSVDASASTTGRGWDLYKINASDEVLKNFAQEPDYSDVSDQPGSVGRLRKRLMQAHGHCTSDSEVDSECMNDLVKFLLGAKTRSSQAPGSVAGNRWPIADLMHSEVVSIPYGVTADGESIYKIVFGTNDGGLHMHDARTGEEHFVIYPQEVLDQLANLEGAESGAEHIYGLDGSASFRIRDVDGDFVIEPEDGDFIHFYIGMRRGGYLYYAFNLTPESTLRSHGEEIGDPELLWVLRGTTDAADPLSRLGQTWSRPQYTRITVDDDGEQKSRSVLIFGGGYDAEVEDVSGHFGVKDGASSNLGNAIYIVDADTGELVWWASSDFDQSAGVDGLAVDGMTASIAADIKLVDSNNDKRTDRLYAVDLMGQIWRVDLNKNLSDSSIGLLATLAEAGRADDPDANEHQRKFFYEPDFVRVKDENYNGSVPGGENYDLIAVVSGNRANPTDPSVRDRTYVIRDYLDADTMQPAGSSKPSNFPACNPSGSDNCGGDGGIDDNSLLDVTNDVIARGTTIEIDSKEEALSESNGFFFDLIEDGEVGFSKTQVLAGKMYFTTYSTEGDLLTSQEDGSSVQQCQTELGKANLYVVDVISGSPLLPGEGEITVDDRALTIGKQPVTEAVPVVTRSDSGASLLEGRFQAGTQLPPDPSSTELQFYPTFWYQK